MISFDDVKRLAANANVIPLYSTIPADLDTPVSAYLKLRRPKGNSFLLESWQCTTYHLTFDLNATSPHQQVI